VHPLSKSSESKNASAGKRNDNEDWLTWRPAAWLDREKE
jgi:hypothetical protein